MFTIGLQACEMPPTYAPLLPQPLTQLFIQTVCIEPPHGGCLSQLGLL